jgi:hypothetical protein
LQTSEQLVFLAFGVSKIIVGELRVFLLQLSLHLVPSAFECEFVHSHFSFGTSVPVAPKKLSGQREKPAPTTPNYWNKIRQNEQPIDHFDFYFGDHFRGAFGRASFTKPPTLADAMCWFPVHALMSL